MFLFGSCSSIPKEYKPGYYSITVNNIADKDNSFNKAISKTLELDCIFFSFTWYGNTLSFHPTQSQYDLRCWSGEEFNSKYYDTRDSSIRTISRVNCVNEELGDLKTELEDLFSSEMDTNYCYREDNSDIVKRQNRLETIYPKGYKDYGFFWKLRDDNYKWYYPLKKVNLYFCNFEGVRYLCDFVYDINKTAYDYKNEDFMYKDWAISLANGYLNSAGALSKDYRVYNSLYNKHMQTNYFVIEYVYGLTDLFTRKTSFMTSLSSSTAFTRHYKISGIFMVALKREWEKSFVCLYNAIQVYTR